MALVVVVVVVEDWGCPGQSGLPVSVVEFREIKSQTCKKTDLIKTSSSLSFHTMQLL